MEEEILKGLKNEVQCAGLELSEFLIKNLSNLSIHRHQLRFHYELLILKMDEYEKALAQYAIEKNKRVALRRVK